MFLNGLHVTNLRTNLKQCSLKIWGNLRTANLNPNFTGSYKKSVAHYSLSFNIPNLSLRLFLKAGFQLNECTDSAGTP